MANTTHSILLRLPKQLFLRLKKVATKRKQSINSLCTELLDTATSGRRTAENSAAARVAKCIISVWGDLLIGLIIFGSHARGEDRESSDVDLLIVLRADVRIQRDLYRRWDDLLALKLVNLFPHEISPHFVTLPTTETVPSSLWLECAIDGIVIWDRESQVGRVLARIRAAIAAQQFVRREQHGHGYWVLG